ncbi:hypothetical protein IWX76_002788 [Pedobacter sp. CAN_A7]|uniref:hypothetical protein n=1 Tax=Pedobacter sp. CAN_A7 TaxID=2787722 RepID=UPI0018CAE4DD
MKKELLRTIMLGAAVTVLSLSACKKDSVNGGDEVPDADRWITLSGAIDDPTNPTIGDGDAGTMVYSLTATDAKNPNITVNVFDQGMAVKSQRTARLQASADGKFLYNIQYTGEDGGIFNKYSVNGGKDFRAEGAEVETSAYVSASPRWLKAVEGVGVAVKAEANPTVYTGTAPNFVFQERTTSVDVISLDLNNPQITKIADFQLKLTAEEVAAGYYVSRIDVPVVNKAGNKVFIGAAVSKHNIKTFTLGTDGLPVFAADNASDKSWAKTLVLDYPSLANPKVLTSTKTKGNTNGYRSTMQYVGTDGHVYQATSGEKVGTGGSKILRLSSSSNEYDNDYVFSLDQALSLNNTYIETWKYAGDGIGFVVYSVLNNAGTRTGGYIARIDLNTKTATKYAIANEGQLSFNQIQSVTMHGDDVFIAVAPVGQDGNILVFSKKTGEMTVGAKLVNKPGNQYIGVY